MIGGNFRLDAIQAAVLLAKLPHLESWSEARRRNAAYYSARFAGTQVRAPRIAAECVSIYNQYCIQVPNRNKVQSRLAEMGVSTEIYYPVPLHLQECFSYLGYGRGILPVSEQIADEILALPIYPELSAEALEYVADSVLKSVQQV
jgi:dTDP-4-amino-4,6-dideoxygalactose transaminase